MNFSKTILAFVAFMAALSASPHQYNVKAFGMEQGLSSNYVVSIEQDKHGFLWFATEEGLNRFDGLGFYTFYKDDKHSTITGNELNCLLDDPRDPVMWIATQRNGLDAYNYDTGTFRYYRHDDNDPHSMATNDVTSVSPSADGNIWITTYWKGADYLDKRSGRFTHYNKDNVRGLPDNTLWCLMDAGGGIVYLGHARSGMSILDTKTRRVVSLRHDPRNPYSISSDEVSCIYRDRKGTIWVGTGMGLDVFDPVTHRFLHFTDGGRFGFKVMSMREMSDGRLWLATEMGGIAIIDNRGTAVDALRRPVEYLRVQPGHNSISGNSVRCIREDRYGNKWIGLYGEGVNLLSHDLPLFGKLAYSPIATPWSLTFKSVFGIATDAAGWLWAGTDGDGINVFDPSFVRRKEIRQGSGNSLSVQTAYRDSKGRMWFGYYVNGARVYSGGTARSIEGMDPHEDVRAFCEDRKGGYMFVGTSLGIVVVDMERMKALGRKEMGNNLVRTIAIDGKGRLWVGTFGDGLYVMSPKLKVLRHYSTDGGFISNTVNHIVSHGRDGVFVATAEGIARFADAVKHYDVYDRSDGLANNNIRAMAFDRDGNLWASTNKGISCKPKGQARFVNYNYKDNVVLGNFNASSVAQGPGGMIYFGSNSGLCYFNPARVLAKRVSPAPIIAEIDVMRKDLPDSVITVTGNQSFSLDYDHNTFVVKIGVSNFALADQTEYSYKLEGFQNEWIEAPENNITFRNLPPGRYTLVVRSRLRNQPWSNAVAKAVVTIEPPFWLTWWAKAFYAAAAAGLLAFLMLAYRRHVRLKYLYESDLKNREQEQELSRERLQFYTNITHELRTPLTLIIGPLEDLADDASLSPSLKRKIEVIRNSARRLNNLVSKILEFRKTDTGNRQLLVGRGNIVPIIAEICSKYDELNQNRNVKIVFKASQEIINVYFDKEVLTIILDNLMSNAMKYTARGSITMSVELQQGERDKLLISVADTGYGISEEAIPHIFERYYQEHGTHQASGTGIGLSLVKSLTELHEGHIEVESKPGEGSKFTLLLDASNTYATARHKADAGEDLKTPQPEASDSGQNDGGERKPIMLIVEDNIDICRYIADSFAAEFEIVTAGNGRDGLKEAFRVVPDIIISDVMMPFMDGNEMCRRLKTDIRTNHIPIILLTAKDSMAAKEEGYLSGADSYITKPFVRSLIASRVDNLLSQRRLLAQAYNGSGGSEASGEDMNKKREMLRESLSKADKEFLAQIDGLIAQRMAKDKVDVDWLSEQLNISPSTLYRKMKALTGLSTNEYVRKFSMAYAEKLLLEGRYTISEISYMVGMNTTAYFRKCFKEEYGVAPSEYLNRLKNRPSS